MTKETLKNILISKPGYIKSGAPKIARLFGVTYKIAKSARKAALLELEQSIPNEKDKELYAKFLEWNKEREAELIEEEKEVKDTTPPSIKDQEGMHILIGCNHVPFENKKLHKGLINLIKDYKEYVKGFHLMGDFMDINTLSSHDKGKFTAVKGLTLDMEYAAGNKLLDEFDSVLPSICWKTYLYGNHEDRHKRWMRDMNNAKTPLESPTDALSLWDRGYQVKESWAQDYFTIGKEFDIFHGIYFSIHCAKAHIDKLRRSCAFVHTHRQQMYCEGDTAAFNIGSAADFTSPAFNYATRPMKSQWSNGFAIAMVDEQGNHHITQIMCQNGEFFFGGKKY